MQTDKVESIKSLMVSPDQGNQKEQRFEPDPNDLDVLKRDQQKKTVFISREHEHYEDVMAIPSMNHGGPFQAEPRLDARLMKRRFSLLF